MSNIDSLEPIPLVGGISRQHDAAKPGTHVKDAINVVFDIRTGARKRPGTRLERKFSASPNADIDIEVWTYDAEDEYEIVLGSGGGSAILRIFRKDGAECDVTISAAAQAYMDLNDAGSVDLAFCPQTDYALVINRTVEAELTTTAAFDVERDRPTYASMVAFTTSLNAYVHIDTDTEDAEAGYYQYDYETYSYAHINYRTVSGGWSIPNGFYDDPAPYDGPQGFRQAFRRVQLTGFTGATWDDTAKTLDLSTSSVPAGFNDTAYPHRPGDQIYISGVGTAGAGLVGWQTITNKGSATLWTLGNSSAANGTAHANASDGCRIGRIVQVAIDFHSGAPATMHDVAEAIQVQLRAAGLHSACCAWVPQSVGGAFQVTSPWRGNNAAVYAPEAPDTDIYDLTQANHPFDASVWQGVNGSGGAAPDAQDTATPESRWTRVGAPSQALGQPDPDTMPIKIVRDPTDPEVFTVDVTDWTPRTAGTATNNPGVSILTTGQKITDAVTHDGRLFIFGGPYVCSSQVEDNFSFFKRHADIVVDSDPIDKKIPGRKRGAIKYAVSWNDVLVVFAASQFELSSGDLPLTPTSAVLNPSTSYEIGDIRPRHGAAQMFFCCTGGDYVEVFEYYYNDLRAASDAACVTRHVSDLIPSGTVRGMALVAQSQTLLVYQNTGTVYAYRWHYDGAEKVQSAWSKFEFDGGYRFAGISANQNEFVLLTENTAEYNVAVRATMRITIGSHGLVDGNPITFSESTTTPAVDGTYYVDVIDANTLDIYSNVGLTVPVAITVAGTVRHHVGDFFVERLSVSDTATPANGLQTWPYYPHVDRRLILQGSHAAGVTTFTLPNTPAVQSGSAQINGLGSTLNVMVLGSSWGANSGDVETLDYYGTTSVGIDGNYSTYPVIIGRYFESSLDPGRPYRRNSKGLPDLSGGLLVLGVAAAYQDSCSFRMTREHPGSIDMVKDFSNDVTPKTGTMRTLLGGDAEQSTWTISDVSAVEAVKPWNILSLQYDVEATPMSQTR